jgi:hypothetical protein
VHCSSKNDESSASVTPLRCYDKNGDYSYFGKDEIPDILRGLKDKGYDCSHDIKGGLECHEVDPSTVHTLTKNPDAVTVCNYTPWRSELTCSPSSPVEVVSQCKYSSLFGKRFYRGCSVDIPTSSQ